jgi:hypothetical protein
MKTSRKDSIIQNNIMVQQCSTILHNKFPEHNFYIHSDGDPSLLFKNIPENKKTFFPKSTNLMLLLSDFIHCDIFVCGCSSLSVVSTFLGEKSLIIVPDGQKSKNKHSIHKSSVEISHFIQQNKENV